MARYIDADNFRKTMIKRFGCIPCLTDYSDSSRYDIPIDDALNLAPAADVAPRAEVFEGVDKFRSDLMGKFIDLCRGNDYNKLTLLKIDAVVCEIYDKQIAELKKKYTDATDTNDGHK